MHGLPACTPLSSAQQDGQPPYHNTIQHNKLQPGMLARCQSRHLSTSAAAAVKLLTACTSSCGCCCGCMRPWHCLKDSSDCCTPLLCPRASSPCPNILPCGACNTLYRAHANIDTRTHPLNATRPLQQTLAAQVTYFTLRLTTPTSRCAVLTLLDLPTARHSSNSHRQPSAHSTLQVVTQRHMHHPIVASKC